MKTLKNLIVFFTAAAGVAAFFVSSAACAEDLIKSSAPSAPASPAESTHWFTGPLLTGGAKTTAAGHTDYELAFSYANNFAHYNSRGVKQGAIRTSSLNTDLEITQGLSSRFDLSVDIPFHVKWKDDQTNARFADINLSLDYQLVEQKTESWIPDVKLVLGENFPTGRYRNLNPIKKGTDSTGVGSYQTSFGINLQRLWTFSNGHALRARLSTSYSMASIANLRGFNTFGGDFTTNGTLHLGDHFSTALGFEYSLTQHWVPAIDLLYTNSAVSRFVGTPGASLDLSSGEELSIAPAIEYNVTKDFGLILGDWFSLAGRNTSDFNVVMLSLSYSD